MTATLRFFQNAEKSDSAKAFGNVNKIKTPANQVCALITRLGPATARQARIETNKFNFDVLIVPLITVFSFH
jgi:hypothetical protein